MMTLKVLYGLDAKSKRKIINYKSIIKILTSMIAKSGFFMQVNHYKIY